MTLPDTDAAGGGDVEGTAVRIMPPEEMAEQRDLLRLARLVAAGILRTRSTPDGMKIEKRPESKADRAKRLERKRKRQLKRRARK